MTTTDTRTRRAPAGRPLAAIPVREAMHRGVIACAPHAPLPTVARTMAAHRIHAIAVAIDTEPAGWGIVSDLDLVAGARDGDFEERTAQEAAAAPGSRSAPTSLWTRRRGSSTSTTRPI